MQLENELYFLIGDSQLKVKNLFGFVFLISLKGILGCFKCNFILVFQETILYSVS